MFRRKPNTMTITITDNNERYIFKQCTLYLHRHLTRNLSITRETLRMICWTLGPEKDVIGQYLLNQLRNINRDELHSDLCENDDDFEDYADTCLMALRKDGPRQIRRFVHYILHLFQDRIQSLERKGASDIEINIRSLKRMFNLTDQEIEFCVFLFIITSCEHAEAFFMDHLNCHKFIGHKHLTTILQITKKELDAVLSGTIDKIGLIEHDKLSMQIEKNFIDLFQNPTKQTFSERFYRKVSANRHGIEHHYISDNQKNHMIGLLKERPKTSTHILFYGPPGTGKTSLAYGLIKHLGIPAFEIARGKDNTTLDRRAAIVACLNMTNTGAGSIILVDEADNILNTRQSWFTRGETQDKGWLNQLLEEPETRMIWITNSIDDIEDSVLRRFAYSVYFKPFNRSQRVLLWDNVLSQNKCKRFFNVQDIENLAKRFDVSAGVMDLAVKKASELTPKSKHDFYASVTMALDAHLALLSSGTPPIQRDRIEHHYSLNGLNINGDVTALIRQLEQFDKHLKHSESDKICNLNLLFYGPPGTGKSEFARYLATHLNREILCKRVSDIQNMWVGQTEKNIKKAFSQAESQEAVLIFDEADSFLFARDRALRSWEVNFTNEFLTQMENFRGILICTTNRNMDLDEASIRRFNHKIEFDYLTGDGNIIFYEKLLQPLIQQPLNDADKDTLKLISNLTPGDFKTVRDRFAFYLTEDVSHHILIKALAEEARIKNSHLKNIRIGF